jgi:hypothetical protein
MSETLGVSVLFLDVDGVLVNLKSLQQRRALMEKADPGCVAALNRILDTTKARVVVSSCWRIGRNLPELRELLRDWGVKATVIGRTPNLGTSRGSEIAAWLKEFEQSRDVASIVILDDDRDMDELSKFLVQTEFEPGLTEADADRAIAVLKEKSWTSA